MLRSLFVLLALAGPIWAVPPTPVPWVTFPEVSPAPTPEPPPAPPSPVPSVQKLTKEELYVIDSKEPCFLLASPGGLVGVTQDVGPLRIRGRFVGTAGKVETKTFQGPTVFTLEATGTGRVELLLVKAGAKGPEDVVRRLLDVDNGEPRPPPTPEPIPPTPTPIPGEGLRVLLVYDPVSPLSAAQLAIRDSREIRTYLSQKCAKGPDGRTPEWRVFPTDEDLSNESAMWKAVMARKRPSLPWLVIGTDRTVWEGPWPATVADTLALLKKIGG